MAERNRPDDNIEKPVPCARLCCWTHARAGDAAMISGCMGSSDMFDGAIREFAVECADQTQRDHRAFVKAVREGRIRALVDS